jgi:hypothetical protein
MPAYIVLVAGDCQHDGSGTAVLNTNESHS